MDDEYDLCAFAADLLAEAKVNLASNNIVVPVLQCFHFLLEGDVFDGLVHDPAGLSRSVIEFPVFATLPRAVKGTKANELLFSLQALLTIVSRNISRLKNVQRIEMSMKVYVRHLSPLHICATRHAICIDLAFCS